MKVPPGAARSESGFGWFLRFQLANSWLRTAWEEDFGKPERIVTALDIMTKARWAARRLTTNLVVRH